MNDTVKVKPPLWFWIVMGVLILWNIMGCLAWVMDVTMTEETLAGMPPQQAALYSERPFWIIPIYAIAVFGGLLGSVLLLLCNKLAQMVYAISLLMVFVQFSYVLFVMDAIGALGFMQAAAFPIFIFAIGAFELWLAGFVAKKSWF